MDDCSGENFATSNVSFAAIQTYPLDMLGKLQSGAMAIERHPIQGRTRLKRQAIQSMTRPLKMWLYTNRKNPYPSKADKERLALETRMSFQQVSNWFANARRRLKSVAHEPEMSWEKKVKLYKDGAEGGGEEHLSSAEDNARDDSHCAGLGSDNNKAAKAESEVENKPKFATGQHFLDLKHELSQLASNKMMTELSNVEPVQPNVLATAFSNSISAPTPAISAANVCSHNEGGVAAQYPPIPGECIFVDSRISHDVGNSDTKFTSSAELASKCDDHLVNICDYYGNLGEQIMNRVKISSDYRCEGSTASDCERLTLAWPLPPNCHKNTDCNSTGSGMTKGGKFKQLILQRYINDAVEQSVVNQLTAPSMANQLHFRRDSSSIPSNDDSHSLPSSSSCRTTPTIDELHCLEDLYCDEMDDLSPSDCIASRHRDDDDVIEAALVLTTLKRGFILPRGDGLFKRS